MVDIDVGTVLARIPLRYLVNVEHALYHFSEFPDVSFRFVTVCC